MQSRSPSGSFSSRLWPEKPWRWTSTTSLWRRRGDLKPNEEFLADFRQRVSNDRSIKYEEIVVNTAAETVEAIRGFSRCNLFLIGRMPKGQIVAALNNRSECLKLGTVGNLLMSPEIKTTASVLVMQQYRSQLTGNSLASLKESEEEELNSP